MNRKKTTHDGIENAQSVFDTDKPGHPRRPYAPPRVLSAEVLEAAAGTCDPPAPPLGKSIPIPCGALGS
ncbi:MAG: hypothetical protein DSY90_11430 [Deltaproteobacteria bacterium]|nr:MAG: hypothetical protein DSY90_11430 [Deltaproteobacteria bacterium]